MEALNQVNSKKFILAGKAIFTIRSKKTGARFTYRVKKGKDGFSAYATYYMVQVLTGTDNNSDYKFFGSIALNHSTNNPVFKFSNKANGITQDAKSVIAMDYLINNLIAPGKENENIEIFHEGRCGRCGRLLTVPESIESGIGPECAKRA